MRTNWEIRALIRRKPLDNWLQAGDRLGWARQMRYMSHTLHFDSRRGLLSLFAFGKPQALVRLPYRDIVVSEWRETADGVVCAGKSGTNLIRIAQLTDLDAWVVRLDGLGEKSEAQVAPLLVELKRTADDEGIVSEPGRQPNPWSSLQRLRFKEYGSLCVRTDGRLLKDETTKDFRVAGAEGKSSVTMVFLAATGTGAEARKISFATDGCVFENDAWRRNQSLLATGEKSAQKRLLRFAWGGKVPGNELLVGLEGNAE